METKYRAFVSYSHADTRWGEWLQRALELAQQMLELLEAAFKAGPKT